MIFIKQNDNIWKQRRENNECYYKECCIYNSNYEIKISFLIDKKIFLIKK